MSTHNADITPNDQTSAEALYAMGLRMWNEWTLMWNERPELAREIVAERFVLHLPTPSSLRQETVNDPATVERWVRTHRAKFQRLVFSNDIGPFVDIRAGIVAGPWIADTSVDGSPRPVCGMDAIAFRAGRISEYWSISKEVDVHGAWAAASSSVLVPDRDVVIVASRRQ